MEEGDERGGKSCVIEAVMGARHMADEQPGVRRQVLERKSGTLYVTWRKPGVLKKVC